VKPNPAITKYIIESNSDGVTLYPYMSATSAKPHTRNAKNVITLLLLTELFCPSDSMLFNQFIL